MTKMFSQSYNYGKTKGISFDGKRCSIVEKIDGKMIRRNQEVVVVLGFPEGKYLTTVDIDSHCGVDQARAIFNFIASNNEVGYVDDIGVLSADQTSTNTGPWSGTMRKLEEVSLFYCLKAIENINSNLLHCAITVIR